MSYNYVNNSDSQRCRSACSEILTELNAYANQNNPNNPAYRASHSNHANQCNPNNKEFSHSRSAGSKKK